MKNIYTIGIVILVIIVGGAFFLREDTSNISSGSSEPVPSESSEKKETPSLGTVPETNIQNPDGSEVALSEVLVRNTVINSWAAWCPFCVKELAEFAEFASEREGEIDLIIVNRGESVETGEAFLKELGLSETSMRVFYDEDQSLYQAFGGFSMPETIFVDSEGEIRFHKRGPLTKSELENIVNNLGW